jgi:tetraacyldisaccharide 4'-kinase
MSAQLSPAARVFNALWYGNHPARWLLFPFAAGFQLLAEARREAYRRGWARSTELAVPVIVVGNLTVGGTGKTPFVIWLARELSQRGFRVGIVTRGYGGQASDWPRSVGGDDDPTEVGDEAVLLARRTGCPVAAGPDRVAAAQHLLRGSDVDILLADDGMQHYRLNRRLELMVVDGERGLGNGLCLPAGPLREPAARLREVDAIIVNGGVWGHAGVFRANAVIREVYRLGDRAVRSIESFRGSPVHAVAGIGNPQRFFDLLEAAELEVIEHPLDDHAAIEPDDLQFEEAGAILVTEKDAVKCERFARGDVWCVAVDLVFDANTAVRLMRIVTRQLGG